MIIWTSCVQKARCKKLVTKPICFDRCSFLLLRCGMIAAVMLPGGLILSQQPLVGFEQICGPDTIAPDRYLFYRNV